MQKDILIIDDDERSVTRLTEKLQAFDSEIVIHGPARTCAEARAALLASDDYNLIISSPTLAGGDLTEVFRETPPQCFVVFTSMPDEHSRHVIGKFRYAHLLGGACESQIIDILDWLWYKSLKLLGIKHTEEETLTYWDRITVRDGCIVHSLGLHKVLYLHRDENYIVVVDTEGQQFLARDTIQHLSLRINPNQFFRLNRSYMVSRDAVVTYETYGKSRLRVVLKYCKDTSIIVSRDRVKEFKDWVNAGKR